MNVKQNTKIFYELFHMGRRYGIGTDKIILIDDKGKLENKLDSLYYGAIESGILISSSICMSIIAMKVADDKIRFREFGRIKVNASQK